MFFMGINISRGARQGSVLFSGYSSKIETLRRSFTSTQWGSLKLKYWPSRRRVWIINGFYFYSPNLNIYSLLSSYVLFIYPALEIPDHPYKCNKLWNPINATKKVFLKWFPSSIQASKVKNALAFSYFYFYELLITFDLKFIGFYLFFAGLNTVAVFLTYQCWITVLKG